MPTGHSITALPLAGRGAGVAAAGDRPVEGLRNASAMGVTFLDVSV